MIPELGWPPCRRHGRGFRRATCGPLLRVAGNASSLESLPRRSVPQTAFCTSRQALLCSASRDRALVCSGSSCFRFGLRAAVPPKLCLRVRTTLVPAAVTAAYGCVPRGQWAPLDADMFELIDRSACLVEPVVVGRAILLLPVLAQTCTQHVQRRDPVAAREYPHREALRKVLCSPSCSSRAAPVALVTKNSRLTVLCTLSP